MLHDDDLRVIALDAALTLAQNQNEHIEPGNDLVGPTTIVTAAEKFLAFLKGPVAAKSAGIQVAWRGDDTPSITPLRGATDLADHGKSLPATQGSTPLVSTTVVRKSPESLREMRARAEQERRDGAQVQSELDNPTERF